jgi:hypothetical protein
MAKVEPRPLASWTGWHTPAVHVPPRQSCPQTPQLAVSVLTFAQDEPQAAKPAGQPQVPALHVWLVLQAVPSGALERPHCPLTHTEV